jgi:TolB-like protein/Tfp pilus assembly protein PilF
VQTGLIERNAGLPPERRIEFRVGIHLGDVVEESDGDLMGDGVNIAARLESVAKPGTICLSEQAYWQVKGRLDLKVTDLGATQLKNIAEPIHVYSLEVGQPTLAKPAPSAAAPEKFAPPRLSIVVLPFANLGSDPEQDYFVDAVTESLTTDLSRIADSSVVARNTASTYKSKPVDAKQIGRELNVRYIVEGSIQRGAGRMRVNVQLIDSTTGNHLWAERYDKPVADLFDMQDEIVANLANRLRAELIVTEGRRAQRETNPDSKDLYMQGVTMLSKGTPDHLAKARDLFERAVALDSENVDAIVGAARVDIVCGANYFCDDRAERLAAAEAALTEGLSIAPRNYWAHLWMGLLHISTNRAGRGIAELEQALALNRNLAAAHGGVGLAKIFSGRAEESAAHVAAAFRIAPSDSAAYIWNQISGLAKLVVGADEEAVELLRRSLDVNRTYPLSFFYIAAALAQLGRMSEARSEVRTGLALAPRFSIERFRAGAESDNPTYLAQRERIIEGMRKAGVPEE